MFCFVRQADNGGAFAVSSSTLTIDSSNFNNNSANLGGAIAFFANGSMQLRNSSWQGNTAFLGGALCANDLNLDVYNCTFTNNSANAMVSHKHTVQIAYVISVKADISKVLRNP